MSAIVGIYFLDGRAADHNTIHQMLERVKHRGPDRAGVWCEGSVGLGHRMLLTTSESLHEKAPLVNKSGDIVLTADARIDNRHELINALGLGQSPSQEMSDSELIVAAYERWGERCPERLLGDFAFAIWDKRRRSLFCARDHFGVKPFYYYYSGRAFVFASEIKAIFSLPEIPQQVNEPRIADYLVHVLEGFDKSITFYKEIFRLPPSHSITCDGKGGSTRLYWSLDPNHEVRCSSDEEYAEKFLDLFTHSVRCRLRSAFPVGSMLSGGLDSSSIVCVARKLLQQNGGGRLHTFSAISEDASKCGETPYINSVLRNGGLHSHTVRSNQLSPFVADLERFPWMEDDPFGASTMLIPRIMYTCARESGTRILLDGIDGDIVASHDPDYLAHFLRAGKWDTAITEASQLAENFKCSSWKLLFNYGIKPLAPKPLVKAWRILHGRGYSAWEADTIINPDFARRVGLEERLKSMEIKEWSLARTLKEEHWRTLNSGNIPAALERYDKTAAAFAVEPRHPFLDKRLVEFCLGLPAEQKIRRGWTKRILRRAMKNILPEEVRRRCDRVHLNPDFFGSLLAYEKAFLQKVIVKDSEKIADYVNVAVLNKAYQHYLSSGDPDDAFTLWEVAIFAKWLERIHLVT